MPTKQEVDGYLKAYIKLGTQRRDRMSASYARLLENYVPQFIGSRSVVEPGSVLAIELRDYVASLPLKQSSKSTVASAIVRFFQEHFMLDETQGTIVTKRFPRRREAWSSKSLSKDQLKQLFDTFGPRVDRRSRYRDQLQYSMLATTLVIGARRSQIPAITEWELKDDTLVIGIPRLKNVAQDISVKRIPLETTLPDGNKFRDAIIPYVEIRTNSEYLFCDKSGKKLSDSYLYTMLHKHGVNPHALRHTAGTFITRSSGIAVAAALLDHERVATTQGYIQRDTLTTDNAVREAWK